ncbi:MAG: biotin synthase BioB [Acidobacteria bacterium]|nr:biotin synthase BioB [Acidobacteriota bacterium]MCB9398957.1 biotin synthase BioB [Acidobacteriota bacterium]
MDASTMELTREGVSQTYNLPLFELIFRAQGQHRKSFDPARVQVSSLLSIKTGGCPEDCGYCPQAARYHTDVERTGLMSVESVRERALQAKAGGADRFCMGAAWRSVKPGKDFDQVLEMVRAVSDLGMETCCTLGMLQPEQAQQLKEAGLNFYNHNIDTSESFYGEIISTRHFSDRLDTLHNVREAGINVCTGGILGMGESDADRIDFLLTLASLDPQPESVTINALVPVEGTPLAEQPPLDPLILVRVIAAARILIPQATIRLSAGRLSLSEEAQFLCFLAGANSIFAGDKLLTTPNPTFANDHQLLEKLGYHANSSCS